MSKGAITNVPVGQRPLPSKEVAMFKTVLKFHEHKQYKKGLKQTEQILKKFPEHGETLAMKGLLLHCLGRKEEGYTFADLSIKNDPLSYTVWHVNGLMYRADRRYSEALKCYTEALKSNGENVQVIRDYSLLQIQLRNFEKYNVSRHQLLKLRPTNPGYWIGAIMSNYFTKRYSNALDLIKNFKDNILPSLTSKEYILSELLLFQAIILEDSGDLEGSLKLLENSKGDIVDKLGLDEIKTRVLLKQNKYPEAESIFRDLLKLNLDSKFAIEGIIKSKQLELPTSTVEKESEVQNKLLVLLNELHELYPRSHYLNLLILKNTPVKSFEPVIRTYLDNQFKKGIPSNFVVLRKLYDSKEKAKIIENIALEFETKLRKNKSDEKDAKTLIWVLLFLSKNYDYKKEYELAEKYINEAIELSSDIVELYLFKARLLKHAGKISEASQVMEHARNMDLSDRYINTKAVKYMLRNGEIDKAREIILLFSRPDAQDPVAELVEMQSLWYTYEIADAYRRKGDYGESLKYLYQIHKHFDDFYDDQLDFHSYSLRKVTLRSYLDLLNFEDGVFGLEYFKKATKMTIDILLKLYSNRDGNETKENQTAEDAKSQSERKKAERKAKKAVLSKDGPVTSKPITNDDDNDKVEEAAKDASYYLSLNPLEEAAKIIKTAAVPVNAKDLTIQCLAIDVYTLKKQYVLAFSTIFKANALDESNPNVHISSAKLYNAVINDNTMAAPIKMLSQKQIEKLWGAGATSETIKAWNENFLKKNSGSDLHKRAYEEVKELLK